MSQALNENAKVGQVLIKEFGWYGMSGLERYEVIEVSQDKDSFGFHSVKVKALFEIPEHREKKRKSIEERFHPITEFEVV